MRRHSAPTLRGPDSPTAAGSPARNRLRKKSFENRRSGSFFTRTLLYATDRLTDWVGILGVHNASEYTLVCIWAACLVLITCVTEMTSSTAYGKFGEAATFSVPPQVGWWLMELPVTLSFGFFFFHRPGPQQKALVPRICAAVMCMHYAYRGWIYPYLLRPHPGARNNFSLVPALGGSLVTITHGYLNARWFAEHGRHLKRSWLKDPRFIVGALLYISGFITLVYHDYLMRELRASPGPRYRIPRGGLFEYATQAVYFCELWTWLGFFLLSWGPNGLFILGVSLANLVPRSVATHRWYLQHFGSEYEQLGRSYLIPFIW